MSAGVLNVAIPPEVAAFAAEQGVSEYLPGVIEMTQRILPGCPIELLVVLDPEIPDDRHIVLQVPIGFTTAKEIFDAEWRWCGDIVAHCPPTHSCVFRLGLVPNAVRPSIDR